MGIGRLFALLAASIATASGAQAQTLDRDAAVFGAREHVHDISLSPDGSKIAYIASLGDTGEVVYVVDLQGAAVPLGVLNNTDDFTDLTSCNWATNERLICGAYFLSNATGQMLGFTRLVAIGADGSDLDLLSRSPSARSIGFSQTGGSVLALDVAGESDKILMARDRLGEKTTGTRMARSQSGLGVDLVDIHSQSSSTVELPDEEAVRYIADETGRVRIKVRHPLSASGSLDNEVVYLYRQPNSDDWERLAVAEVNSQIRTGFYPLAVDASKNVVYGFDDDNGYQALFSVALDGSLQRTKILGRDDVDVDGLVRIGRGNRVVGASYATEKRRVVYFDPTMKALAEGLARALPGNPMINIVDASEDERKLIVLASSDVDPGMAYLYDTISKQLSELLPLREGIADRTMGQMTPVTYPASDGAKIPGYLTLPPGAEDAKGLPAIVLPHGGPSARDEWGFDWLVQFFAARGYAVLQPNFRGSNGYGSAWFGQNGFQAWRIAVGDVNDAGRWLISEGIAAPDRLAVVGWSYGGYAALQSQALDSELYQAIVAIAPVTDLDRLREESRGFTNFGLVDSFIGTGAHVREGSPAQNAGAFSAPVMLVHGTADQNVDVRQSRFMKDRLENAGKDVEYLEFEDLDHQLDSHSARVKMLSEIGNFLESEIGG